ncbi:MAG: hypothetical protein PPFGHCPK_01489 (plasmid) [Spiroplasma endosymbiont of Drosophila atripex]|nr:MAG: hypothetical protein PPFGHCPK_01489 [Spiroplasma endosymbiont of Drosophila atripex]
MKRLLSILGAMTLIGTTSTSVVACGGEKPSSLLKIFADLGTDKTFMLVFDKQGNLYSSTTNGSKIYKM